jgi:hypothetical protein
VTPAAAIFNGSSVTIERQDCRQDLVAGDVRGAVKAALAGRGDGRDDDRRRIDVERADRRLDALRQAQGTDVLLDGRARLLDICAELKLGDHEGNRVGAGRADLVEPRDTLDGALYGLSNLGRDVARTRAGVGRDDGDDGEVDVGQQLLLERTPG